MKNDKTEINEKLVQRFFVLVGAFEFQADHGKEL